MNGPTPATGRILWLTGLPGAGKTTLACALDRELTRAGRLVCVLDGDALRRGLCSDLGFDEADRRENVRRAGEVAKLLRERGILVLVALISPRGADRVRVRSSLRDGEFIEVFVNAPLDVCERRDPKGLYRAAREGRLRGMTGIDAPYEPPERPEIELKTDRISVDEAVRRVMDYLRGLEAS